MASVTVPLVPWNKKSLLDDIFLRRKFYCYSFIENTVLHNFYVTFSLMFRQITELQELKNHFKGTQDCSRQERLFWQCFLLVGSLIENTIFYNFYLKYFLDFRQITELQGIKNPFKITWDRYRVEGFFWQFLPYGKLNCKLVFLQFYTEENFLQLLFKEFLNIYIHKIVNL